MQSPPRTVRWAFVLVLSAIVAAAVYGWRQGTPQDIVNAVRRGDLQAVSELLARDPSRVSTQVYPQALETLSARKSYLARTGQSGWQGRTLLHDAMTLPDPVPMLDLLARAGASLQARIDGRSLLHLAARDGQVAAARWLIAKGLDKDAGNNCGLDCAQQGRTPLYEAAAHAQSVTLALLLAAGASVDLPAARGQTPLHAAAAAGSVDTAWMLCRHGADPALVDLPGLGASAASAAAGRGNEPYGEGAMAAWLVPQAGCAQLLAQARSQGRVVDEEQARRLFADFLCQLVPTDSGKLRVRDCK